jgi:hypothetical protein
LPLARVAGETIARIDALNQLVRDLLLFARPPRPNPTPVDLAKLLSMTALLIREGGLAHGRRGVDVVGHTVARLVAGQQDPLDAGASIEADDGSIARILGKRPVLWVGAGLSIAAGYPTTGALIDASVAPGRKIDLFYSFPGLPHIDEQTAASAAFVTTEVSTSALR